MSGNFHPLYRLLRTSGVILSVSSTSSLTGRKTLRVESQRFWLSPVLRDAIKCRAAILAQCVAEDVERVAAEWSELREVAF